MVQKWLTFASGLQSSSSVDGVPKEAVAGHLDTHHTRTAGACSINSEVDNKDRLMNPAGPLAGSAEVPSKMYVPSNAHISTPFFHKTVFSLKYSLVSPPQNFWRYVKI